MSGLAAVLIVVLALFGATDALFGAAWEGALCACVCGFAASGILGGFAGLGSTDAFLGAAFEGAFLAEVSGLDLLAASGILGFAGVGVANALLGAALGDALAAGGAAAGSLGVGALLGSANALLFAAVGGAAAFADDAAGFIGGGALFGSADALLGAAVEFATEARSLGDHLGGLLGGCLSDNFLSTASFGHFDCWVLFKFEYD